jgi:hypothetical protein
MLKLCSKKALLCEYEQDGTVKNEWESKDVKC